MDELEQLRAEMRQVTAEIMKQVRRRMEIATKIGEVKTRRGMDVFDGKAEEELRTFIMDLSSQIGLEKDLAGRLLNFLLSESTKIQARKQQTPTAILAKAKQLEREGKKIVHLEVGELDFAPHLAVKDALADAFDKGHYHYTEAQGVPELRLAVSESMKRKFNAQVGDDQVIITHGGRFAVFLSIAAMVKPGEEVIVVEPGWPAYKECAEVASAKTKILKTSLEDRWTPDLAQLENMITDNTRMIVINYPNNPTGKVLDAKNVERIVEIARKKNVLLLSDEVYSDYSFTKFASVLDHHYDNSIIVSSFSKGHAMTGFRVGYAVANKEIIQKMSKLQAVALTSVAEPMQYAAIAALKQDVSKNVDAVRKRLSLITGKLEKMPMSFVKPEGGMYVFARIDTDGFNGDQFVEQALQHGLALAPGSGFGSYPNFIRISAGKQEDALEEGLEILQRLLR